MVREAVNSHGAFSDCTLRIFTKGSYPNNTNVRTDSDVDVAVQCQEAQYWGEHEEGAHPPSSSYSGIWTPSKLRSELVAALEAKFPDRVDTSGSTAIRVHSSTARVDADVVPCFDYAYYFASGSTRLGSKTFKTSSGSLTNYPDQHLANGRSKNNSTKTSFKKVVRIMKRVENAMLTAGVHREVPSYFIECLVYNCPDPTFSKSNWTAVVKGVLWHIWDGLEGDEPAEGGDRWLEVNGCKYLFSSAQKWDRQDGRNFAKAAWNYLGLSN
jgi:hypothetical protein